MPEREIDLCLISGARPDLLERTLRSFQENMFRNFDIADVFANVDAVMGDEADRQDCVGLIRRHFPDAVITQPDQPSFGRAVKTVWTATGDRPVFHLEDDWLLTEPVYPAGVLPLLTGDVGMVQPSILPREAVGDDYLMMTKRRRFLGIEYRTRQVNSYGTSPRFFQSGLAKLFGKLLKPRMDPEKQVFKKKNRALMRAHEPYKCRLIWASEGKPLIVDIGRDWRKDRSIEKVDRSGFSSWKAVEK